jgi:hypothetical protein
MINIANNEIKFNDLEEKMWKIKMKEGLEELKYQLKVIDDFLLKNKDNKKLSPKDFRETTIKCKFGDLKIFRRRYKLKQEDGTLKNVYLLDQYLELGYSGQYSQSIVELVIKEVIEKSYRKTAETISNITNLNISHNAARNIVLDFAEKKIKALEKKKIELYEKGYIEGTKERDIIFEESDGIFISKQNRKRKNKKEKLKKEIKIAVIHEGFKKRYKNDFKVQNKQMVATIGTANQLKKLVDMTIGTTYAVHKLKKIIINADGAGWCKSIAESPIERYQLDMFHIQKKIRESVHDKDYLQLMSRIVKTDKPEDIFNIIYNYKVELESDENKLELEKVNELEEYLKNNKEGLLRYQYDLGYNVNEINMEEEIKYRNLGTEESQMFCGCRKRMKKNRTSWSDTGAEAMVKLISYVKSNEMENLISGELEKEVEMELKSRIPHPAKVKKKKIGKIKETTKNIIIGNLSDFNRLYIKDLLKPKSFNEMRVIGN